MKFFFDNCIPPAIANALKALGVEGEHLRDRHSVETTDVDWIPKIQGEGFVAVTGDEAILRKHAEREALEACGLRMVFFVSMSHLKLWPQASLVIRAWPEVEKWALRAKRGECARVTANARLEHVNALTRSPKR